MAGITTSTPPILTGVALARRQMLTVLWLRWRIFVNAFRSKGAAGELIAKILSYPMLAMMVFGPSIGAGFGAWYTVTNHHPVFFAAILWGVFLFWQVIGITTSATGPSFDLTSLIRFPIRYRDYFLLRLSFGLLDPQNLVGFSCLTGVAVGVAIAAPALTPWAALTLLTYGATNLFFSRMLYAWLERFLAQRKTRELVTVLILFISLGIQVLSQMAGRFSSHHGQRPHFSPLVTSIGHNLLAINWFLPPGLAASAITRLNSGATPLAFASLFGLATWATAFTWALHRRLLAQYHGENLSEAPSASKPDTKKPVRAASLSTPLAGLLSPATSALVLKEFKYLLRSGPKLYALVLPAFMVLLFSGRASGLGYAGIHQNTALYIYPSACAYLQLMLVAMLYNSLGQDARGIQFYFMAPIHLRQVLFAKNLLTFFILLIELVFIYICTASLTQLPPLDITVAAVFASLFLFLIGCSIGNVRSIVSPKVIDPTQVRKQNISGLNSLISLAVTIIGGALCYGTFFGSRFLFHSNWPAALTFALLTGVAAFLWFLVYRRLDLIAEDHRETLSNELCKAG